MMTADQIYTFPDLAGLTEDEKKKLISVMKKAKVMIYLSHYYVPLLFQDVIGDPVNLRIF